ncbi:MAG: TRAP transporter large permease [Betaproteobacteria bacterium]|nr:TRAP transporter large permease [Betaproteobacteria bacterium]
MLTVIAIAAFVLLFLGIPMWMIFLILAIGAMTWQGVSMEVVVQGLSGTINKLVLLAVPGFIFAGGVMGEGGMSARLIAWVSALMGRLPGGMALTTITAAELFGAISGSSTATVAGLGRILYPALLKEGYRERFSLGLITSAGAIAIIIPPSITMILFAVMSNASLGKLYLAGFLPGIVVGICGAVYCVWYALKHKITSGRTWDLKEIARTTRGVFWTLGAPVVIFGGIYGGFMTPTEASMAVSVYAVIVSVFIYRELTWRQIWNITRETALLSAKVFIIVAASGVFSWVLTAEAVPQRMVGAIEGWQLSPVMILVMINIIVLVIGMFMDPNSAIILFTPLLWPIAEHAGTDLIHFGIIFTVNLAVGMFSPPFGLNIFVSCSIFKKTSTAVVAGLWPFFVTYAIALAIITYVPELSLWLPNLVMK